MFGLLLSAVSDTLFAIHVDGHGPAAGAGGHTAIRDLKDVTVRCRADFKAKGTVHDARTQQDMVFVAGACRFGDTY